MYPGLIPPSNVSSIPSSRALILGACSTSLPKSRKGDLDFRSVLFFCKAWMSASDNLDTSTGGICARLAISAGESDIKSTVDIDALSRDGSMCEYGVVWKPTSTWRISLIATTVDALHVSSPMGQGQCTRHHVSCTMDGRSRLFRACAGSTATKLVY